MKTVSNLKTSDKTKERLVNELAEMRQRVTESETSEAERRKTKKALRESEEKLRLMFDSVNEGITITDPDGNILQVNEAMVDMCGYDSKEELAGLSLKAILAAEDHTRALGVLAIAPEESTVKNVEYTLLRRDGSKFDAEVSAALLADVPGSTTGFVIVIRDITQRKQAEELYKTLFHSAPVGVYILQEGKIQYANPQFQKLTGNSEDELLNRELLTLIVSGDRDVREASIISTLEQNRSYPCEYRIISKTGQIRWVMETVTSISHKGRAAILGNLMDISERKHLERKVIEYEELNKLKSNLLSTVSHELRTPLATIKGYSTMMIDYAHRLSSDEKKEYLQSIDRSTVRLTKLIDNLLDMSRLEAGLMKMDRGPASISKLIRETVTEAQIRTNDHKIVLTLKKRLPRLNIDAFRIRQVLDNLIDNAVKYSALGTEVTLSVWRAGQELLISVADQGIGIPVGELPKIFDRMYRVEQRLTPGVGGIGLGLSLCKLLAEAHGGRIWVESEVEKGSTFYFALPIETVARG